MTTWPYHVLMTTDTLGGVWTFALELAAALISRGTGVTLATSGGLLSSDQRRQARQSGNPEIIESRYRLEWQDNAWEDVDRAGGWLSDIVDRLRPDVLHLNDYANAARDWNLPVVVTGHSCVLSWFAAVKRCGAPSCWREYHRRVEAGLRAADVVTAPSYAMLAYLEEHYGLLPRAMVIPNARSVKRRRKNSKEPFIFAAGRIWDEAKNIVLLTEIADQLPWPVYVAGDSGSTAFDNVHTLGKLDGRVVQQWMSRASIYCLPVKYEPFGLSILEAALSGCALVLGDIESQREIWDDCALFVDPNDARGLQLTLKTLIGDAALREGLANRALLRANRYSPERMIPAYLTAYSAARQHARGNVLSAMVPV